MAPRTAPTDWMLLLVSVADFDLVSAIRKSVTFTASVSRCWYREGRLQRHEGGLLLPRAVLATSVHPKW